MVVVVVVVVVMMMMMMLLRTGWSIFMYYLCNPLQAMLDSPFPFWTPWHNIPLIIHPSQSPSTITVDDGD